jgi:hypothetical protein
MEHEFEDEIEFFTFLPSEFYEDVEYALSDALDSVAGGRGRKSVDTLENALCRNMSIFEKYTRQNIFTFPPGFVYERKKGAPCNADLKEPILDISILLEKRDSKRDELSERRGELARLRAKREELYGESEQIEGDLDFILEKMNRLTALLGGTLEVKKKFLVSGRKPPKKEYLGSKEVMGEVRKRECERAERISKLEVLERLGSVIP